MKKINGGATLWARQTIDSDIFYNKPSKWFKIWFYLVNEVNYKDSKQFARGSSFIKYEWIMRKTKTTKNEVAHCIKWLKSATMIATAKATGGFTVKVLNYNAFQSLENYKSDSKSDSKGKTKATQKQHKSHTILKKVKKVKNKKDITKVISSVGLKPNYALIINYLNKKTGSNFDPKNKSTMELIRARFNEGRTVKDFVTVIDKKIETWLADDKMNKYLRPSTLFNRTKFENYLNEP
ncbi:hypothetical protein ES695_20020, partial [Candidatus Atribacteria bacterium 1244-E10-H5-B2]